MDLVPLACEDECVRPAIRTVFMISYSFLFSSPLVNITSSLGAHVFGKLKNSGQFSEDLQMPNLPINPES